eukprot:GFUD01003157.1.p1 GENE.GFUD01003157.1~~GFUD01003157.1.p1  ORF type:complete len:424 (-),score=81.98 GFUD01003157.1:61-1332(-)
MTNMIKIWLATTFILNLLNVTAKDVFPDYYKVNYSNSRFPTLQGFYKQEDYTHQGKPVYKKPRLNQYLYCNKDDKWTVGVKWTSKEDTEDRLTMEDAGNEEPTNSAWFGQKSDRSFEKINVSITEFSLEYPEYYEVKVIGSHHFEGFYEKLPESENYEAFPVFTKRPKVGAKYLLYLHPTGEWQIRLGTSPIDGTLYAKSTQKGLPSPELSKDWNVWKDTWKASNNLTVVAINPVYPASYTAAYYGQDQDISYQLQSLNVLGNYAKQSYNHNKLPVYKQEGTLLNLFRVSNGNWVFSFNVSEGEVKLYQESKGSPTPLQNKHWKLNGKKEDITICEFYVNPTNQPGKPDYQRENSNIILIVGISWGAGGVLIVLGVVGLISFCHKKSRGKENPIEVPTEEPAEDEADGEGLYETNFDGFYETL